MPAPEVTRDERIIMFVNIAKAVFNGYPHITSKATALKFYKSIKCVTLIPCDGGDCIRVEPDCHIAFIEKKDVEAGTASLIPALRDEDGSKAYELKRYINTYPHIKIKKSAPGEECYKKAFKEAYLKLLIGLAAGGFSVCFIIGAIFCLVAEGYLF